MSTHWVDAAISNNRTGRCICGREEGVQYGPHIFGYGNCCIHCQREWERQHGGARWQSNDEGLTRLCAEKARAKAEGRDEGDVVRAWNRREPPFEKPARTDSKVSAEWQQAYDLWGATLE